MGIERERETGSAPEVPSPSPRELGETPTVKKRQWEIFLADEAKESGRSAEEIDREYATLGRAVKEMMSVFALPPELQERIRRRQEELLKRISQTETK